MRRRVAPGDDGRWPGEPPEGGDTSETRSAILSGILEREPGGTWSEMFFHMVKMISCVCKWRTSFGRD